MVCCHIYLYFSNSFKDLSNNTGKSLISNKYVHFAAYSYKPRAAAPINRLYSEPLVLPKLHARKIAIYLLQFTL